jgi:hypothetical protein
MFSPTVYAVKEKWRRIVAAAIRTEFEGDESRSRATADLA